MMMAVSFERRGRLHYLDPGSHRPAVGDKVLVPTDTGPEVAECIWAPQWIDDDIGGLPVCAGLATEADPRRGGGDKGRGGRGQRARGAAARRTTKPREAAAPRRSPPPGPPAHHL